MNGTNHVKIKLEEGIKLFPQIRFRYEEDIYSIVHFIEVSPASFRKNENFIKWRKTVFSEFISLFPYENICFFREGNEDYDYESVEKWELIIEGSLYKEGCNAG